MIAFYWIDRDGEQCFGEAEALPKYAIGVVPRLPGPFERWDAEVGDWIYDADGHADWRAGPAHIAAMHQRKAIEAALVEAGIVAPSMLIVREAALRGIAPADLAAIVRGKVAESETIELERQAASLGRSKT